MPQQAGSKQQFMGLSRRQGESDGMAAAIGDHTGLRREPAPRPAESFALIAARTVLDGARCLGVARILVPSRKAMPTKATPAPCGKAGRRSQNPVATGGPKFAPPSARGAIPTVCSAISHDSDDAR
jgi:hypothetical protein